MKDVAPELLKRVMASFNDVVKHSEKIKSLTKLIRDGKATYKEANEYSILVGEALAKAYKQNISSDVLPDGKMYYNIAKRVIEPSMVNNYNIITNATDAIQKALNDNANIGVKPITPVLNQDRIDGIINRVSSEPVYDDVSWILDEPVVNFSQSIVDDSIKCNSEFQGKSGMSPKIVRKLAGGCCEWCMQIAGTYTYPDVPKDVYRRHQRCRCTIEYDPGTGKRQNVHSKEWETLKKDDIINERKIIGLKVGNITIKGVSAHILKRMQDRFVSADDIIDTINTPLKITDVKYDNQNRPSVNAIGERATISINPDTGILVTTHKTHSELVEKIGRKKK